MIAMLAILASLGGKKWRLSYESRYRLSVDRNLAGRGGRVQDQNLRGNPFARSWGGDIAPPYHEEFCRGPVGRPSAPARGIARIVAGKAAKDRVDLPKSCSLIAF